MAYKERFETRILASHLLMFGDGTFAEIMKRTEEIDYKTKMPVVRYLLKPGGALKQAFNIPEHLLLKGYIQKRYPLHLERTGFNDPYIGIIRIILCDYNGGETTLTELYPSLLKKFQIVMRENSVLKSQTKKLINDIETQRVKPLEGMDMAYEIIKKWQPMMGDTTYEGKDNKDSRKVNT